MADPQPESGAEPVTAPEITELIHRLARHRACNPEPAERAALLTHKAQLLARISDRHTDDDPAHAAEARQLAHQARTQAARHADPNTQDTSDVNDIPSPSSPRWGISLSNTAEFRRAPSPP
jgi:hypothetical protein